MKEKSKILTEQFTRSTQHSSKFIKSAKNSSLELSSQDNFYKFIKKVADTTPSLITVYSINSGEYLFINNALTSMLGYDPEDWKKKGVAYSASKVHPDDFQALMAANQKAVDRENSRKRLLAKPVVENFEYRMQHKDGSWRWLHTFGTIFDRTTDGKVRTVLNVSLDITERKKAEEKLQQTQHQLQTMNEELEDIVYARTHELEEREEQLKEAQRISKMGSWNYDLKNGKITWSEELFAIHGLDPSKEEPTYEQMLKVFDKPSELTKRVNAAIKSGTPYNFDAKIYLSDGTPRYIQAIGKPIYDDKGKCIKLYGAAIDITERKNTEVNMVFLSEASKILAMSLDYQTTLQSIAKITIPEIADWCSVDMLNEHGMLDQIVVAHKDPKKVKWAKEFRKKSPPDMDSPYGLGNVLRTGKAEFYPFITHKMLEDSAKTKKELQLMKSLGFRSIIIVPIFTNQKPIGAITFITTESQKQYTKSDFTMAQELGHRISLAVENAKLYKAAQDAVKLRDEFISIASHELKTPVTSMKMYAQVLKKIFEKDNKKEPRLYLQKINDQIEKQTKLIFDLLDISKLQVGKLQFKDETFNLEKLLYEIVEGIQLSEQKHTIKIVGHVPAAVRGDPDRIGQVIINLLTNAIKYSPKANTVMVRIAQNTQQAKIAVQDFGIGIAKKYHARIFDRFYQVSDAAEKTFPGLGIGLFISNEIIKRHMGEMSVKSIKGKGSTFEFWIPNAK